MDFVKKTLKDRNTDVALVPAGLMGQLQPLDISINKPFKQNVLWSNWMAEENNHEFTQGGRLKKPSTRLWCQWVLQAWADIDPGIQEMYNVKNGVVQLHPSRYLTPQLITTLGVMVIPRAMVAPLRVKPTPAY
jgi:hypothetical protein